MTSEGVGSYWPFATGRMVDQANLLLKQIMDTPSTRYKLIPNQHVGADMLEEFFRTELGKFLSPDLHPTGRHIIECCMDGGAIEEYVRFGGCRFPAAASRPPPLPSVRVATVLRTNRLPPRFVFVVQGASSCGGR